MTNDQVNDPFAGVDIVVTERPANIPALTDAAAQGPRAATQKQVAFIRDLATKREIDDTFRSSILARCDRMDEFWADYEPGDNFALMHPSFEGIEFKLAGEWITRLKAKPWRKTTTGDARKGQLAVGYREVETDRGEIRMGFLHDGAPGDTGYAQAPAGRYALDTSEDGLFANDITFFHLWIGSRYGWAVKVYRSGETYELAKGTQIAIARRIMQNPKAASALFGQHIGSCGVCGRTLTNDESRAIGIGPVCRVKMGW